MTAVLRLTSLTRPVARLCVRWPWLARLLPGDAREVVGKLRELLGEKSG
jgi:hypothetical protein